MKEMNQLPNILHSGIWSALRGVASEQLGSSAMFSQINNQQMQHSTNATLNTQHAQPIATTNGPLH